MFLLVDDGRGGQSAAAVNASAGLLWKQIAAAAKNSSIRDMLPSFFLLLAPTV